MLKSELILIVKLITIYTLLQIPKNDTLPKIADFTIIAKPIQLVQIPTTKNTKNCTCKSKCK